MKRILPILLLTSLAVQAQQTWKRQLKLMGSRFEITVVAPDKPQADAWIDLAIGEITRIEKIISSWDPASQTSEINRNAGVKAVSVSPELYDLISRCLRLSEITDGAFDISYASMDQVWKFDGSMEKMPGETEIRESVRKVGFSNIHLDPATRSVLLKRPGMKIGFGAVGKGYAADRARKLLMEAGAPGGIINASGDMTLWGRQPDGTPWQVGITNPLDKTKSFGALPVEGGAVVTSGNYEKFVTLGGRQFSHIIDPRSGYPAEGIASVTVVAPAAELADALSTAVFVMGIDTGLNLINQMDGIECLIVDVSGRLFPSDHLSLKPKL